MTIQSQRLYYDNSYLMTFESTIIDIEPSADGLAVELEQTAFYPTSGGQPHDRGYINGVPVTDVYVGDRGQVVHELKWDTESSKQPLLASGQVVSGQIEWQRRHHHMQHHTGQHILSACFEHVLDTNTIAFHLGTDDVTIDIDDKSIDTAQIEAVENKANEIISANIPVVARFIDNAELDLFRLRKPPQVSTDIRIVSIGDFDDNACGGTHVQNTAEVGLLKILKTERIKKGLRVHFLCGHRAFQHYQQEHRILSHLGHSLSAGTQDLAAAIESLQKDLKITRKNEKLLRKEAAQLLGNHAAETATLQHSGLFCSVSHIDGPYGAGDAKAIATAALVAMKDGNPSEHSSDLAAAVIVQEGQKAYVALVSSPDSTVDCGVVLKRVLEPYRGKGGGNQQSAQGSIQGLPQFPLEEFVTNIELVLSQC